MKYGLINLYYTILILSYQQFLGMDILESEVHARMYSCILYSFITKKEKKNQFFIHNFKFLLHFNNKLYFNF